MPLREVKFSKKFPYDSFLNYDLGYVWDMEEGETREEIEDKLLKMANDNHRRNYPQFYQQTPNYSHPISEINNYTTIDRSALTPIEEPKISPEQEEQSLLEEIANATAETLEQWKIPALRNIKTKGAYNLRKKQLGID